MSNIMLGIIFYHELIPFLLVAADIPLDNILYWCLVIFLKLSSHILVFELLMLCWKSTITSHDTGQDIMYIWAVTLLHFCLFCCVSQHINSSKVVIHKWVFSTCSELARKIRFLTCKIWWILCYQFYSHLIHVFFYFSVYVLSWICAFLCYLKYW